MDGIRHRIEELSRRLRPLLVLRNLAHRRELVEVGARYRALGLSKPWFGLVSHAEVAGRGDGVPRLDGAGGIAELGGLDAFRALPEPLRGGLEAWPQRGYLVAEGLIDRELIERAAADLDVLVDAGSLRSHHRAPRFMNAHLKSAAAAEIASDPGLIELIELILGRPARLFQTITFIRGSEQEAHSDAFHMMTEPPGFLVGVWVALEDIEADSGPVFYVPGSHLLPYVMSEDLDLADSPPLLTAEKGAPYLERMREMTARAGGERQPFTARAGDVLLWHHNLLHGGAAIARPGATRRSLVGHYFASDVLCYHEVTERPALLAASAGGRSSGARTSP